MNKHKAQVYTKDTNRSERRSNTGHNLSMRFLVCSPQQRKRKASCVVNKQGNFLIKGESALKKKTVKQVDGKSQNPRRTKRHYFDYLWDELNS